MSTSGCVTPVGTWCWTRCHTSDHGRVASGMRPGAYLTRPARRCSADAPRNPAAVGALPNVCCRCRCWRTPARPLARTTSRAETSWPPWHTRGHGFEGSTRIRSTRQRDLVTPVGTCLLYTSDAADDLLCVDLGGRRIIKKKKKHKKKRNHREEKR